MADNTPENPSKKRNLSEKPEKAAFSDDVIQQVHSQLMREKEEPEEGFSPVPIFLLFIFAALMFWGGIYFTRYSGDFRGDIFDYKWTPGKDVSVAAVFDPIKQGKKMYARQCQQCHQVDGNGIEGVYPHLNNSSWVLGENEEDKMRLVKLLLLGMSGEIIVDEQTYNGNMPPVGMWKDRDIAAVLTYVRQHWDNNASPVEEALVTKAREEVKGRTSPWEPAELLKEYPF